MAQKGAMYWKWAARSLTLAHCTLHHKPWERMMVPGGAHLPRHTLRRLHGL